jgi:tyrosine-protein kinase
MLLDRSSMGWTLDLPRQLAVIRRSLPLLIISVVLAAGFAYVASNLATKIYQSRATLIIGQSLSAMNPDYGQLQVSQRLATTYASIATTRPILDRVAAQLGLDEGEAGSLADRVHADAPSDNTLLYVIAQDSDPAQAMAIANAVAAELIAVSPAVQGQQLQFQESIAADLKATQEQIGASQTRVEELTSNLDRTPAEDAELSTLEGRLVTLRATYSTLLSFSAGSSANLLSVIDPAVAPGSPESPKPLLNVLIAAVIALLLTAVIVFIADALDDKVKDPEAVRESTKLSTLGTIGRMKSDRNQREIYRLAAVLYPRSSVTEAYRTLRTNIEFASVDSPIKTLLITSSVPGEGKTVTAANLAVVFAQAGKRVLLVDADLRKPGVHLVFDLPNEHGLTSLLRSDDVNVDRVVQSTEQANLRILTTGPLPPNPAELLGSKRMRTVLDRLMIAHDLVIFDSPPLQAVTDAAIVSAFFDGTLFVIDAGRSRRRTVHLGREALDRAGATVLGAVLNRSAGASHADYASYYGAEAGTEPRAVAAD